MSKRTIGVRELKANLSAYIRYVKTGESILITERGKPVVRLMPVDAPLREKLKEGVRSHMWAWNGKKWQPAAPKIKARGKVMVSELLLDDRE